MNRQIWWGERMTFCLVASIHPQIFICCFLLCSLLAWSASLSAITCVLMLQLNSSGMSMSWLACPGLSSSMWMFQQALQSVEIHSAKPVTTMWLSQASSKWNGRVALLWLVVSSFLQEASDCILQISSTFSTLLSCTLFYVDLSLLFEWLYT